MSVMSNTFRIGYGFDVHKLVKDRELILGGVSIPYKLGLAGHSDADVLLHAIMDALLGSLALGDIGTHFPDTESNYKDIDSRILLKDIKRKIRNAGYEIANIDSTIVAQQPKLAPYMKEMRMNIAKDLEIDIRQVSVNATTSEELGFEGRGEGISARAVVLIFNA